MTSEATLLVPLDGSAASATVLPYAEGIAGVMDARLLLFTVISDQTQDTPEASEPLRTEETSEEHSAAAYLESIAQALTERGVEVTTSVVLGQPADEILVAADEPGVSMVVMATQGYGGVGRWLVGSVADKVMRIAGRPVLLVRPPETPARDERLVLKHLLVPLDGSPLAETAVPLAVELAHRSGATLTLVRFAPHRLMWTTAYGYQVTDLDGWDEEEATAAKAYLEGVRDHVPKEVTSASVFRRGEPAPSLTELVREEKTDLVIMSTHGRGGLWRFLVGSTADRVVRSGIPTLLVRAGMAAGSQAVVTTEPRAQHCATCGRLISFEFDDEARCPRCRTHLHTCANCVLWDGLACALRRPEAHDLSWPGRSCPQFIFRLTPAQSPSPSAGHVRSKPAGTKPQRGEQATR